MKAKMTILYHESVATKMSDDGYRILHECRVKLIKFWSPTESATVLYLSSGIPNDYGGLKNLVEKRVLISASKPDALAIRSAIKMFDDYVTRVKVQQ